jgi:hypothetical protein
MNELFTHEDFIAAKEFARIECSDEIGKTLKENIEKTLLLLSKMSLGSGDLSIDPSAETPFFIDFIEDEKNNLGSDERALEGLSELDQDKLKMKACYLRLI